MTLYDEIHLFARDFINDQRFRTSGRKQKIREAYKNLTGELLEISCSTCYTEALYVILNRTKMATKKGFELKKGVLLQAFGDASKTCTNDTLTDELAVWYLSRWPEKAIFFSKIPFMPEREDIKPTSPEVKKPGRKPKDLIEQPEALVDSTLKEIGATQEPEKIDKPVEEKIEEKAEEKVEKKPKKQVRKKRKTTKKA